MYQYDYEFDHTPPNNKGERQTTNLFQNDQYSGQFYSTTQRMPEPVTGIAFDQSSMQIPNQNMNIIPDGIPLNKQPIYEETSEENSKWNDLFFAFIFLTQMIGVFGYGGNNTRNYSLNLVHPTSRNENFEYQVTFFSLAALSFSYLILALMRSAPESFIKGATCALICLNLICMFLCFLNGIVFLGIVFVLQAIIVAYFFYVAQPYISFSTMLLKTSTDILNNNKSIFLIPLIGLVFAVVYSIFLLYAMSPFIEKLNNNEPVGFMILLFIFLFFWTQQVAANVVHVTTAGVVGKWYYKNDDTTSIVWKAFKRSITKSFGSVCFGSLIVAVIKTIQFIIRMARSNSDNACIMCCLDYVISCFEQIVEYFNEYAYAYVGIYGISYVESAKKTWEMAKGNFITALFNDNLIYPVLLFSDLFIGICTGFVSWLLFETLSTALACGIVGFAIASIVTNLVHSSIVALFVCCIEDFAVLNNIAADLFNMINITETERRQRDAGNNDNNSDI